MSLIIIADDDELVVDIVRQSLERRGHVVGTLDDGRAVKSVVEIKRPDLVILDCSMDDVSGIIALRDIRASRKAPTTPVLMLTSRRSSADEEIARLAGADDYLRKPFDTDELVARVEVLLEKSAEYQARRAPPDVSDGAAARGYLISFHASIDRTVFDAELLADVQRLIPPERLREYLRELDRQLQLLLEAAVSDESLAQRAHKIVSQAGMLGLTRMSQCARVLEEACRAGNGQAAAQGECRAATGDIERYAMPAAALSPEAKTANG